MQDDKDLLCHLLDIVVHVIMKLHCFTPTGVCEMAEVLSEITTRTPYEVNARMVYYPGAIGKGQSCF